MNSSDVTTPATLAEAPATTPPPPSSGVYWGTGRRKAAVARVRLVPGTGQIVINHRELTKYFTEDGAHATVRDPLVAANVVGHFDVHASVHGGGITGQAGAIRLGVSRALVEADQRYDTILRTRGFLTRDSRVVERKKPGQRKARRRFQFSKR